MAEQFASAPRPAPHSETSREAGGGARKRSGIGPGISADLIAYLLGGSAQPVESADLSADDMAQLRRNTAADLPLGPESGVPRPGHSARMEAPVDRNFVPSRETAARTSQRSRACRPDADGRHPSSAKVAESAALAAPSSHRYPATPQPQAAADTEPTAFSAYMEHLEGGLPRYTLRQAAELTKMDTEGVRRFWLALGFPTIVDEDSECVFTDGDIAAMRAMAESLGESPLTESALTSLLRASAHNVDRMLQWHVETLLELAETTGGLGPVDARRWVLDHFADIEEFLRRTAAYTWSRQAAALLRHTEAEIAHINEDDAIPQIPRAVGFIDIVSFTNRTERMTSHQFMEFIERFDYTCRAVITGGGGRVVKSMGDAFLFIADDIVTGADIVCDVTQALRDTPEIPAVRASLTWGPVLGRFGDVFGPSVNMASRLADVASPGTVLTSRPVATALKAVGENRFTTISVGTPTLQGLGATEVLELRRIRAH
ncbi:adenylate/guanylate cyclase domain-containing protein [Actinotignum sanguinis]|uniref:Adenylate/guanylate cyclase domain-containing protein n=2 Tax=Actinotignum sanguinis TaxID=1445614 RepID=A0ABT5V5K4_9ACTO|nr:adenylate/guanylate cyclase domain-containing protein [Actinotignum sanguinis]MDE1656059.1 adenylate/guanylate cyclase domain-containing protein [Actinotignum sanguinis]